MDDRVDVHIEGACGIHDASSSSKDSLVRVLRMIVFGTVIVISRSIVDPSIFSKTRHFLWDFETYCLLQQMKKKEGV
jgi:hypothetical protein